MNEPPVEHPRLRKAKHRFPLWLLLPLLAIWLVSLCDDYRSIRESPLEGWSMWRVADQDLMIETTRLPVPWGAADAAGDREGSDLYARWAGVMEKDEDPRSRSGAAILWTLAGERDRASEVERSETENPDFDTLVTALLRDRRPDPEVVEDWGQAMLEDGEAYWWEEQLYLHHAWRANAETTAGVRARAEGRESRCVWMAWGAYAITIGLAVAGLAGFGMVARRGVDVGVLRRVPAVFRRMDWRRPLAAVALSDVLAALLLIVLGWVWAVLPEVSLGDVIAQDTIWRCFPAVLVSVLLFRRPRTAIRALGIDRPFAWWAVIAALGITLTVEFLCWWVLPQDGEDLATFAADPWGFGWGGLSYTLLSACVLAPVCEEIVYRGVLFNAIAARFGLWPGLVIANAVFSATHGYPLDASVATFLFGVVAALLYRVTGSLAAAIVMHSLFNLYCTALNWTSLEAVYW